MDTEILRNFLCVVGILSVMIFIPFAFNKETKKPEYDRLLKSGQKINLNIVTLLAAYMRPDDDPLKPAHKKVAKIGLLYFLALLLGIILVPAMIIILLMIFGLR